MTNEPECNEAARLEDEGISGFRGKFRGLGFRGLGVLRIRKLLTRIGRHTLYPEGPKILPL